MIWLELPSKDLVKWYNKLPFIGQLHWSWNYGEDLTSREFPTFPVSTRQRIGYTLEHCNWLIISSVRMHLVTQLSIDQDFNSLNSCLYKQYMMWISTKFPDLWDVKIEKNIYQRKIITHKDSIYVVRQFAYAYRVVGISLF